MQGVLLAGLGGSPVEGNRGKSSGGVNSTLSMLQLRCNNKIELNSYSLRGRFRAACVALAVVKSLAEKTCWRRRGLRSRLSHTLGARKARKAEGPPADASGPLIEKLRRQSVGATAPAIVEADAHDVVGEATGLRNDLPENRRAERLLGLAEVDVEILELGSPAAPDGPFDARTRGPAGLHVLEGPDDRPDRRGDGGGVLDLTVGDTGRPVEQDVGRPQHAQAGARGAEPGELMVGGHSRDRKRRDLESRAALLARGLNVGFPAVDPLAQLIVVARLEAADDAIDLLRFGERADPGQGDVVLGLAPAVADVHAPIETRPAIDGRGRRRRLIRRPQVSGSGRAHRQNNESSRRKKQLLHNNSPVRY